MFAMEDEGVELLTRSESAEVPDPERKSFRRLKRKSEKKEKKTTLETLAVTQEEDGSPNKENDQNRGNVVGKQETEAQEKDPLVESGRDPMAKQESLDALAGEDLFENEAVDSEDEEENEELVEFLKLQNGGEGGQASQASLSRSGSEGEQNRSEVSDGSEGPQTPLEPQQEEEDALDEEHDANKQRDLIGTLFFFGF